MDLLLLPISAALAVGELVIAGLGLVLSVVVLAVKSVWVMANLLMGGLIIVVPAAFSVVAVGVEVVWTIIAEVVWGVATIAWGVAWGTFSVVMSLFGNTVTTIVAVLRLADELIWSDGPYALEKLLSRTPALPTSLFSRLEPPGLLQNLQNLVYPAVLPVLVGLVASFLVPVAIFYVVPVIRHCLVWRRQYSQRHTRIDQQTVSSGRMRHSDNQRASRPSSSPSSIGRVQSSVRTESETTPSEDRSVGSNLQQRVRQLEVELEHSKERSLCVVCLDKDKEMLLKPCNHLCVCSDCQGQLGGACPVCRRAVERAERVYQT